MKTRRIIILLLALLLATGLLPVTGFATGTTEVSTWEGLQAALSAGDNIVLTADVTPENPYWANALTVPSGVTAALDLNGHRVDRGYGNDTEPGFDGSVMIINGTLTVTDSASGGAITGGFPDQYGGGVQIQGGTFNLLGGSITGNRAGKTGFFGTEGLGGGVYMQSGTFNMSGGSISGNKALGPSMGSSLGRGGGVYVTGGTFNFTGGTISGNTAGSIGGGVYLASTSSGHDGKIYVSGGAITGNTVAGAASNVYLEEGGVLAVTGALTGTIGVTMQTPGVFTDGLSGNGTKENFTSDDAGLVVSLTDAGEAKLGVEEYPLWVGGTQVTSENAGDIPAANGTKTGTASYDAATNTLTLNNYVYEGTGSSTFSGQGVAAIYYTGQPLTVKLSGSNKLTVPQTIMDFAYGILNFSGPKTLTFSGDGSLKIECPEAAEISYGISSTGHVVIDGPMLEIITGDKGIGIYCSSGLAVEMKAGALYSKGGRFAINCAFSQTMFGQGTTKTDEKKLIPIGNTPVNLEGYAEVLYPHPDPYAKVTTAPAANTLTYNGRAQALVTAGTATGGTMKYAVTMVNQEPSSDAYTFDNTYIPTGTDAGTYYVWYKAVGDENHNDSEAKPVEVTIATGDTDAAAPKEQTLTYTGSAQPLVKAGSVEGGTLYYALGSNSTTAPADGWSTEVPTATEAGTYYVWYKVVGDANHNDVDPACVVVTIGEAAAPATTTVVAPVAPAPTTDYTLLATLKTSGKKAFKMRWTAVPGAEGYDVFFGMCNKDDCQLLASVNGTSYKIKGLKKGFAYKGYVWAWKNVGGAKTYIGEPSPDVHAITNGKSNHYTNPKKISVKKKKLTVGVGKRKAIKAKLKKFSNSRNYLNHVSAKIRYYSSDRTVATVDAKGRVTGVGPGKCTVFAVAENGLRVGVKVTVK